MKVTVDSKDIIKMQEEYENTIKSYKDEITFLIDVIEELESENRILKKFEPKPMKPVVITKEEIEKWKFAGEEF